jgi:hypothetical protein
MALAEMLEKGAEGNLLQNATGGVPMRVAALTLGRSSGA